MSELDTVRYKQEEAVAVITIHRPEAMNSFNTGLRRDLLAAFRQARGGRTVRVVVLTGEGRSFSAGADLKGSLSSDRSVEEQLQQEYRPIFECIAEMDQPVIAAVGGSAAGIGMSYALACDLLVMAEDAFLLSPFTTISLVPDGGLNWLLVHQLGYRRAFQLSIECERIPAERCVQLGLANRTAPAESLLDDTIAWARSIAERAPLSLAATKKAMRHAAGHDWASTFDVEAPLQRKLRESEDCAEGVAAFFQKRKPEFKGR
ncbi:MAG TPA: enoyl-CoA hydratase/isomerase family protein [Woeseiaceae bacterium]|nr:enoyl-CoA hydratase/isomerase family protein [Woeseiaceae bacterium]